jgi:hypothetical protein
VYVSKIATVVCCAIALTEWHHLAVAAVLLRLLPGWKVAHAPAATLGVSLVAPALWWRHVAASLHVARPCKSGKSEGTGESQTCVCEKHNKLQYWARRHKNMFALLTLDLLSLEEGKSSRRRTHQANNTHCFQAAIWLAVTTPRGQPITLNLCAHTKHTLLEADTLLHTPGLQAEILSDIFLDAVSDSFDVDVEYDVAP